MSYHDDKIERGKAAQRNRFQAMTNLWEAKIAYHETHAEFYREMASRRGGADPDSLKKADMAVRAAEREYDRADRALGRDWEESPLDVAREARQSVEASEQ